MASTRCQTLKHASVFGKRLDLIIEQGFGHLLKQCPTNSWSCQSSQCLFESKSQKSGCVCAGLVGTFLGAKLEAKVLADMPNDDSSALNCVDRLIFYYGDGA